MQLVDEEFNALVEDLSGALDKFKVPEREKGELLGALGPLKPQIVVAPGALKPVDAARLEPAKKLAATLTPPEAGELLALAVTAAGRGQRSYAEQLFSRAELLAGAAPLASLAPLFREGAPPRVTTALKTLPRDTPPQPKIAGSSDEDEPDKKPARGSLTGVLQVGGKPLSGFAVVMLEPANGKFKKRTPKQRIIEQRGRQFAPHVMAVPVGSTVSFPNFDPLYHNVFSVSERKPFDLGLYKNGETREVKFEQDGIIQIGCNLHPNMSAYLIVVAAPHYAVVSADGKFFFRSLAPGKYKLKAWSDASAQPALRDVDIKIGANEVSVEITGDAPPAVNADKFGAPRAAAP
jgi:plastocyanin